MKKITVFLAFLAISLGFAKAQTRFFNVSPVTIQSPVDVPLHEVRAVWLTTIGGLDWPHSYAQSGAAITRQQNELRTTLDRLQKAGINLVFIQTRVRATTIFPSSMEPWDGCLSGKPGTSPGYDALAFAIEECHKRGMQLHAWVVTIPVGKWNGAGCKNLRQTVPNLLRKIGEDGYMNPELPGTADYLARFCGDLTRRYDIDGIHLDYIRYPETWGKIADKNRGRQYITDIVKAIHKAVKQEKKWVMLSCSPIGKYADLPRQWAHGWNARDIVCQDAAMWMQTGLMDGVFPMMYFRNNDFYPFAIDWKERSNGRIVAPGLGIYFLSPKEKNWPLKDITRELHVLRQYGLGHTYFRSKFLTDNTKGIYDFASEILCPYPSLIPAQTWYGYKAPEAPASINVNEAKDIRPTAILSWEAGRDNSDGPYLTYNVYSSTHFPVNTRDARNITIVGCRSLSAQVPKGMYYAVTAVDRYGNESLPCQINGIQTSFTEPERPHAAQNPKAAEPKKTFKQVDNCPLLERSNTIELKDLCHTFEIFRQKGVIIIENLQGEVLYSYPITRTINISQLPKGVYVVRSVHKKKNTHRLCFLKKV